LALQNGGFMVAWQTKVWSTNNDLDISIKIYDANAAPVGAENVLNANNQTGDQEKVKMCTLSNGNIITTWLDTNPNSTDIIAVILTQTGASVGNYFTANTTTAGTQTLPSVKCLSSGGFIIAWQSQNTTTFNIIFQQFDNSGNTLGLEKTVNSNTSFNMSEPIIGQTAVTKNLVIAWKSTGQVLGTDVWAQLFYLDSGICSNFEIFKGQQFSMDITFTGLQSTIIVFKTFPTNGQIKVGTSDASSNTAYPKTNIKYLSNNSSSDSFTYSSNTIDPPCKVTVTACYISCATCVVSGDTVSHKCTKCDTANSYLPFTDIPDNCYLQANPPSGYAFDGSTNTFVKCYDSCTNCKGVGTPTQQNCLGCKATYYPLPDHNSQCYLNTELVPGYIYNTSTNVFEKCYISCKTCDLIGNETQHQCKTCANNFSPVVDNFTMCYVNYSVVDGYYFDPTKSNFNRCYKACKTCFAAGDAQVTNCLLCADGSNNCKGCADLTYNDACVTVCPSNTVYDEVNKRCKDCGSGQILFNNECLTTCPNTYVLDTNTCIQCQSKNMYTFNSQCVDKCPDNTKRNPTMFTCDYVCDLGYYKEGTGCITCSSENKLYYKNQCYDACPSGTLQSGNFCQIILSSVEENCDNTTCQNNGICGVKLSKVECQCSLPYVGRLCEYNLDTLNINDLIGKI
jgi:hypothetical protein